MQSERKALAVAALAIAWSFLVALPLDAGPPSTQLAALYKEARRREREGDLAEALASARRLHLLVPTNPDALRLVSRLTRKLAKALYRDARSRFKQGDLSAAVQLAIESHELATSSSAVSLLHQLGYRRHRGAWRSLEEVRTFDAAEAAREAATRARLALDSSFRVIRTDHFRVFTDVPGKREWERWLTPVLKVMESFLAKYVTVFVGETDRRALESGLDVVVFQNNASYEDYLGHVGIAFSFKTAGFYHNRQRSSFFYRVASYAELLPTVIHELTHQFNDQLLGSARVTWLNEGLAEYFEACVIRSDYRVLIGRPHHGSLAQLRREGFAAPVEDVFRALSVNEPETFGSGEVSRVYSLVWGWTYFLLHSDETYRRLLFDGIRRERLHWNEGSGSPPGEIYKHVFEEAGIELGELDEEFRRYIRTFDVRGRSR